MLNRVMIVVVFVPLAIILIALAVANRGMVSFTVDPFNPGNPALTISLPLFVLLFATAGLGLIVGSLVTWWKQGRHRKLARKREQEIQSLRSATVRTAANKDTTVATLSRPAA